MISCERTWFRHQYLYNLNQGWANYGLHTAIETISCGPPALAETPKHVEFYENSLFEF